MNNEKFDIGVQAIGVYLPLSTVDNLEQGRRHDANENFILEKIGARELPRFGANETVADACARAYKNLCEKVGCDVNEIECLVVCTQSPDKGGIPHTSAMVHGKLGASENCACFDIGLGCSGYVYSLQVVCSFMQMHGMRRGLLFTCDPYSKILDELDKNTCLLFGDAATVTLLTDNPEFVSNAVSFSTRGSAADALSKKEGKFFMNGRAVFNFALTDVPRQITKTILASGFKKEEIDLFLLHQGSKFMLENTVKKIGDISARCPINLEYTGNTVSSSIPILLEPHINDRNINTLLMSGFGVGLSWATAVYTRNQLA